jgi:hypothetical protein
MRYALTHVYPNENARTGWGPPLDLGFASKGELFSHLQQEYGRCTGKVRVDRSNEEGVPVGWIFEQTVDGRKVETWAILLRHDPEHGDVQRDLRTA